MSTFITSIPVQSRLLLAKFENKATNKCIEIWKTTCIVTNFGKSTRNSRTDKDDNVNDNDSSSPACTVLINPANPELSGVSKFAYFPAGGPVPKHINNMHSNSWVSKSLICLFARRQLNLHRSCDKYCLTYYVWYINGNLGWNGCW